MIAVSWLTTSFPNNVYHTEACFCQVCACRLDVLRQLTKTGFGVVDAAMAAVEAVVVEMGGMIKVYCTAAMQDLRVRVLMVQVPMEEGLMALVLMVAVLMVVVLMVVVLMALVPMQAVPMALVPMRAVPMELAPMEAGRMEAVRMVLVLMVEVLTALVLMEGLLMEGVLMVPAPMALVLMEEAPMVPALMLDQRTVLRMARTRLAMERSRTADMELRVVVNV